MNKNRKKCHIIGEIPNLHFHMCSSYMMNRCRTGLELFFALWFVMGNVWVFDSRFGAFENAPKLYILCVSLLVWNAVVYSFPFLLFLLLCCLVPFISSALGYNMNMGSVERSASDDQISSLPHWKFKEAEVKMHLTVENSVSSYTFLESSIKFSITRESKLDAYTYSHLENQN